MTKVAPSILAADFSKLAEEVADVEKAGVDYLHIDVMDGHFVPNISFGFPIIESIKSFTALPMDVHLMIEQPERFIDEFIEAGAQILTVHFEACTHIHRTIEYIQSKGVKAGVAINPGTPVSVLEELLPIVDLVLIMTVNPGFGGQSFIESSAKKIKKLSQMKEEVKASFDIQVDGGIDLHTSTICQRAGANYLVAGSSIFNAKDRKKVVQSLIKVK